MATKEQLERWIAITKTAEERERIRQQFANADECVQLRTYLREQAEAMDDLAALREAVASAGDAIPYEQFRQMVEAEDQVQGGVAAGSATFGPTTTQFGPGTTYNAATAEPAKDADAELRYPSDASTSNHTYDTRPCPVCGDLDGCWKKAGGSDERK